MHVVAVACNLMQAAISCGLTLLHVMHGLLECYCGLSKIGGHQSKHAPPTNEYHYKVMNNVHTCTQLGIYIGVV